MPVYRPSTSHTATVLPSLPLTSTCTSSASAGIGDTLGSRAELSPSSSETLLLSPESTSGSASGSYHEGLVPQGQTYTTRGFPYLDLRKLSSQKRLALKCRLLKDSDTIMSEFGDLKVYTIESIASRGISVEKLYTGLSSFGAYGPNRKQVPLLQDQLDKLKRAEDVNAVFCILDDYYSFFNYGILEKLIGWFGTPKDKERLETYTKSFKRFCKRRTFECPPDIFGHTVDKGKTNLVVKVGKSWDPMEGCSDPSEVCSDPSEGCSDPSEGCSDPSEGCSLENVQRLRNSLADILKVEPETLYLWQINEGCVELLFQVPSFVEEDIFPLSMEQEILLTSIGVTRLTCGSYRFPQSPEALVPQTPAQAESEVKQTALQKSRREWAEAHKQWAELQNVPPSLPSTSGSSTSASTGAIEDTLSSRAAKFVSARELLTSSETVSLFPESTPGSISGSEHQVLVRKGQTDTSSSFPYFNIGNLSSQARLALQSKLLKDSDNIMLEFGDLKHHTINSIVSSGVSVKELHTSLSSLGAYRPVHNQVPLLRNQMDEIERAEDVRSVFCILDKYYSFFNYGILEKLIGWFGTPEDKERLQTYTENFKRFCKRRTFECPPDVFGHTVDKGKTNLVVKYEESWDPTEGCSLENVLRLRNYLADILEVKPETLYLCRVDEGCIELLFQVPSFVEEDIFPLSMEQERSLTAVGVTRLTCGSYRFPQPPEALVPQTFPRRYTDSAASQERCRREKGYSLLENLCKSSKTPIAT